MKILMVNDNDPDAVVGGSERYIADLTRALETDGHDVHWFVLAGDSAGRSSANVAKHTTLAGTVFHPRPDKRVFRPGPANRWVSILRRVTFYPALGSPDELAGIYRQARAVVLPSLWLENAPLVAVEASAYGRAVVASRVGGLPELVEDGRTGFLFDRGDIDGLAERLHLLLTDPALAEELGTAGHGRLAHLRSPAHHLERLLAVYDKARH